MIVWTLITGERKKNTLEFSLSTLFMSVTHTAVTAAECFCFADLRGHFFTQNAP